MKIKRKDNGMKLKRKPKKRYTKNGIFIIEDKPWYSRYVQCRDCKHWLAATSIYIAEDGTEGWVCPITNKPKLHNEYVVCKHYNDAWIVVRGKMVRNTIDKRPSLKIKKRRSKCNK